MSYTAEGWAWEQACPSSAAKSVLVCLAWYANRDGEQSHPAVATICRRTQLADGTVRKALRDLAEAGLIERNFRTASSGRCTTTDYRLNIREPTPPDLQGTSPPDLGVSPPGVPLKSEGGTPPDLGGKPYLLTVQVPVQSNRAREDAFALEQKPWGDRRHQANGAGPPRFNDPRVSFEHDRPCVNGWYLDVAVDRISEAAERDPPFPPQDRTIVDLLADGYEIEQITEAVSKIVARGGRGKPLAYYAAAVRDKRPAGPPLRPALVEAEAVA